MNLMKHCSYVTFILVSEQLKVTLDRPRLVSQLVIIVFTWLIYDIGYACRERSMSLQIGPAIPAFPLALGDGRLGVASPARLAGWPAIRVQPGRKLNPRIWCVIGQKGK